MPDATPEVAVHKRLSKLTDEQLDAFEKDTILKQIESAHEAAKHIVRKAPRSAPAMTKYLEGEHDGKSEATRAVAPNPALEKTLRDIREERARRRKERERELIRLKPTELQGRAVEVLAQGIRRPEARSAIANQKQLAKSRRAFVKAKLGEKGWSVSDWAKEAGVDHHTVSDYLNGKTKSYPSTRKKLADSLGIQGTELPQ